MNYIKNKKILFVGDVHGRIKELLSLIKKFPNHLIILLGDLQDRGLYSKQVLDLIINNDKVIALKGNHEIHFLDFMLNEKFQENWLTFLSAGGINTLLSYIEEDQQDYCKKSLISALDTLEEFYQSDEWKYEESDLLKSQFYNKNKKTINNCFVLLNEVKHNINSKYVKLIQELPLFYKGDDWIASHAPIFQDNIESALKSDSFFTNKMNPSDKDLHQIHGHTNSLRLRKNNNGYNIYGLDNSRNNQLCALDWKNRQIVIIDNFS